ncbi:MAG: hypothetical protein M3217_00060 [Actinomycetota bacterium]|nr:hypothetical protein [Actinomycetota bacterium]
MLRRHRRAFDGLPGLMRGGLVLTVLGAAADVAHHVGTDAPGVGHASVGFAGHLVTLAGMVVTMSGLIEARRAAPRRHNSHREETP